MLKQWISKTRKENPGKRILLISHSDLIWYLTSYVENGERFGTHLANAEIIDYN